LPYAKESWSITPPLLRAEEARERLRLAARDLRMADLALADTVPLIGEALFHAQQAAEKALKGYLVWHGIRYPLTHDIRQLPDPSRRTPSSCRRSPVPARLTGSRRRERRTARGSR
jgi:hypothetical protein